MTDQQLYQAAVRAADEAYAPYSKFNVGAAVLARDGRVITGANVENAAYPLGVCAEESALAAAVAQGVRPGEVEAIATTTSPCGGCRQWLLEFRLDRVVFMHDGELLTRHPTELIPDSFALDL